jgi:SAM-dependent methyltransferase
MTEQDSLLRYTSPGVVSYYAQESQLQPAERELFTKYIRSDMSILDIGVGGGRTTPYLAELSRDYVGVDYSEAMVEACRSRYPDQRFEWGDAADLSMFEDASFDAVIFSFNGIDTLGAEGRSRCLSEIARVLRDDGIFIFSSHNARRLVVAPVLRGVSPVRGILRLGRSAVRTVQFAARTVLSGAYRAGEGYVTDPVHGGLLMYTSTPETIKPQLRTAGMEVVDVISAGMPDPRPMRSTGWYYYACVRTART